MDIQRLSEKHRVASAADMHVLAQLDPSRIIVWDLVRREALPFSDLLVGPFGVFTDERESVLLGHAKGSGKATLLRIAHGGMVELQLPDTKVWVRPSVDGVQLYIPLDHMV